MSLKVLVKRIAPFLATFIVGLFVASFFVTISAPNFQLPNRGWRQNHREYDRQREIEIQSLREENTRLKNLQNNVSDDVDYQNLKYPGNELPLAPMKAPLAPKHIN